MCANYCIACITAFVSTLDCTYIHVHPFHLLRSRTDLHAAISKREHDRRGSSRIRFDSAPETMTGKQALHKSLHSHLQLFAIGKGVADSAFSLEGRLLLFSSTCPKTPKLKHVRKTKLQKKYQETSNRGGRCGMTLRPMRIKMTQTASVIQNQVFSVAIGWDI